MIKCIYFLLFVAASQAAVVRETRDVQDIPVPHLTRLTLEDEPNLAFRVDWERVSTPKGEDPVLGYKLKIWEQPKIKTYRYKTVDGVKTLVEEYATAKFPNINEIPTHKARVIRIPGADTTAARVDNIEPGVMYEVRVLAYTRNGDGHLSPAMRIEVSNNEHSRQRDVYNVE